MLQNCCVTNDQNDKKTAFGAPVLCTFSPVDAAACSMADDPASKLRKELWARRVRSRPLQTA